MSTLLWMDNFKLARKSPKIQKNTISWQYYIRVAYLAMKK